jgi:exopolyphosphatase/guanosine-5'-triphosphate,3'-diphosphate pyrophosphatase
LIAERDLRRGQFLEWWPGADAEALRTGLDELAARSAAPPPALIRPEAPVRHRRIAALDVGTNSVRLVVAETDPRRGFRVIEDVKESTRLGAGMFADSRLTPAAMDRTLAAVARLRLEAETHRVESLRAIGTAALREALNRDEFLARAESEAGVKIEVVDGEREALLAFASIAGAMDLSRRRAAALDIGGGSAQVVVSAGGLVDGVYPLKLGAVRLTELFAHLADDPEEQYLAMRSAAMETVHDAIPPPAAKLDALIGVGGTCNNLARLAVRNGAATAGGGRFLFAVSGSELPYSEVLRLLDWLRRLTPDERRSVAGLSPQRAEIIVAGAVIVERVMDRLGVERLQVHDGGVRDGLLAEMIDELGVLPPPAPRRPSDAMAAAREYAERCSPDRPHGEHVARLSLHIFDQLAADTVDATGVWAAPEARVLLEIGALLHDCGATIDYKSHHRHGFDMLMRADLPTLTRREREITALLARYHRKRGPETDDPEFRHLSAGDQRLAAHLVGILRIADGLDRTHDQRVSAIQVRRPGGRVSIGAVADREPTAGLRSARRKSDVFARAFHADVEVTWAPASALVGAGQETNE